jgi:Secreted protein acidic and rich in cysteine Ca binding region
MNFQAATTMALILAVAGCQAGVPEKAVQSPSPTRLEYITEFKKIDTASKGRITMEEAMAYYSARFTELDKNGDGFLDAHELDALVPIMNANSGQRLLLKLDRNSDNRLSRSEFLVISNWLFQLASSPNELALEDVEKNMPSGAVYKPKDYTNESPKRPTCPINVHNC